jgi:restriction endonuclease Mrr
MGPSDEDMVEQVLQRLRGGYEGSFSECWKEVLEHYGYKEGARGPTCALARDAWIEYVTKQPRNLVATNMEGGPMD